MTRRAALAATLLPAAALLLAAATAHAQLMGTLSVDFVRADGRGRHVVFVSALDPSGQPVTDLEHACSAELDGRAVQDLVAQSTRARFKARSLAIVIDGTLLAKDTLPAVKDAVRAIARDLAPGDRIRVIGAGRKVRSKEASAGDAAALAASLGELADADTPLLYDALYDAARRESRRGGREGGAILLVTRGADGGSDRTLIEVLGLARTNRTLTPVMVTIVGDEGTAAEADRLQRLAAHPGGAYARVTSPVDLASELPPMLARALQRWVLTFTAAGWDPRAPRHRLEIVAAQGAERRQASFEYATADVLPPPWWRSPWWWIVPGALLLAAGAFLLAGRRRQHCLLVHEGGDEDGSWYEVLALSATLGAAAGNDVVFGDPMVSRNHAVLERRGRNIELVDLNSENGTFVNGERITRRVLVDGDRVSFGPDLHLVFETRG